MHIWSEVAAVPLHTQEQSISNYKKGYESKQLLSKLKLIDEQHFSDSYAPTFINKP